VRTIEPIGAHGAPYAGWITSIESDPNAISKPVGKSIQKVDNQIENDTGGF